MSEQNSKNNNVMFSNKNQEINDKAFYEWLFDNKDIKINTYTDYSLPSNAPHIFYPDEFKNFFDSSPMQRLTRILQLSRIILSNPIAFHTRYEHSLGVFNRKKDIIIQQLKNPIWKKYIEDNNLKVYLIAELIKSAGHDIGHLPLSHVLENSLLHQPGFHEKMGKRILLENKELQKCYSAIHPNLLNALQEVLSSDVFGFNLLDEGNFDIDRLDFLRRDSMYSEKTFTPKLPNFTITEINIDESGEPLLNSDGSINCSNNKKNRKRKICLFENNDLQYLVDFLNFRAEAYKENYFSPETQFFDGSISVFLQELQKTSANCALLNFTNSLKDNFSKIDINTYLNWDDILFYNDLIKFIKTTTDTNLQSLGIAIMPPIFPLINMSYALLSHSIDYSQSSKGLAPTDNQYIKTLHQIISSNDTIDIMLRSDRFKDENIFVETDSNKISELQEQSIPGIMFMSKKITLYKPSEPIFIKDETGRIFTIDSHPDSTLSSKPSQETISVAFTLKPLLALQGFTEEQQKDIISNFPSKNPSFKTSDALSSTHAGVFTLTFPNVER